MNTPTYDQSGNYIALAGLAVTILGKFGIVVASNDIVSIIAGAVTIYGIYRQFVAHKALAQATNTPTTTNTVTPPQA